MAPVVSIASRVSSPFGPDRLKTVIVALASLHKPFAGVITVVVVVVSVVEVEESVTPEEEEEQKGQHFGSQPLNSKLSARRLRRGSERA